MSVKKKEEKNHWIHWKFVKLVVEEKEKLWIDGNYVKMVVQKKER